jgi:outer membrane protein
MMGLAITTVFFAMAATVAAPAPATQAARTLSLAEAEARAEANQPTLRQAESQARAAGFRTGQARSDYLPHVSANVDYERNGSSRLGVLQQTNTTLLRQNSLNNYSGSLGVRQLLFDFGKTPQRIRSARAGESALAATAQDTRLRNVLNVRIAYFQAQGNRALRDSAQRALDNQKSHAELISAQVEAGIRAPIDLLQARSDVAAAELQLIDAENNYVTSKEQLKVAMGYTEPEVFEVGTDQLAPVAGEEGRGDSLVAQASERRPDLRAAEEQILSRRLAAGAIGRGYWPSLSGSAALLENGDTPDQLRGSWSAGVSLTWPLFEGGLTRAQVGEARQNTLGAEAERDQLRLQIRSDIEQAVSGIQAAKAAGKAASESLKNTSERLRLAEERYRTGLGNIIELSDAQLKESQAEVQQIQAEFNLAIARARLLNALGQR